MKKLLLGLFSILLLNFVSAQNGDCTTPSTVVQNDANATPPGVSFNQCVSSPSEVGGKVIVYSTVTSSSNGTLGLIQSVGYNNACSGASLNSLFSTRLAELFPANNCSGVPITPSATIANPSYSSTFNPEWTGLTPNTAYTVRITITVPGPCTGMVNEVCLNQYYPPVAPTPGVYTCGTVDFNLSSAGPFVCTDPVVNLLALDPPSTTVASEWIYPGFIIKVWKLPSYSWTNQKINFLDNGVIALTQNNTGADTLVLAIDHVQPGSYSFGITNIGARQFGYQLINAADGTIAESGTFVAGNTTTAVHSPLGTWNYTIARVGAGAVATGVSNNPSSGGDGTFDPSIAGEGTFDITYSWDNGAGCSGTKTKQVVVTCPPAPCGTVGINWQTGTAPTALNLDCSNNTDYGLKANVIAVAGNYIAPGFTIGDAGGAVNFSKIEVEEGSGTGFVDVVLQKILTFCVPSFQYRVRLTGSGSGTITIVDHATGNSIYTGPFSSGMVITLAPNTILGSATFSGPGVSNYKKNSSTVIGSGYGVFNPSVAGGGSHTITYTWDNGLGCSGSAIIPVTVTCPTPTCPLDQSFIKLDWNQSNPFPAFTPTSFNCNDGPQRIWKNIESANIDQKGELEAFPGFIMEVFTNAASNTNTSVLVSVNGIPYSYYGPGPAPVGVLDWGPMAVPPSSQLILEPYLPAGANISLQICDERGVAQSFAYTVNDYSTGAILSSGTATPSLGNCTLLNFTLSSPVMTWNVDNNATLITNNNDGSGTFDPSSLSAGSHVINYSWSNGPGCTITASQNITINALVVPTSANVSICSGATATLTATNATVYNWYDAASGGNKVGSLASYTTPTLNAPRSYWVSSGSGLCESARLQVDVTIKPDVAPTFNAIPAMCQDAVAPSLQNPSNDSKSGTWNPSAINTTIPGTTAYVFTPAAGQCASVKTINVTINPKVTPVFNLTNDICINTTAQPLPLVSDNSIPGTWLPASISSSTAGTLTYQFTPSAGQCATGASETINVIAKPIASATPSVITGNPILNVDFTNASTNASTFNWNFGNGSASTENGNTSTSYSLPGTYTVTLTASNNICPDDIWTQVIIVKPIDPLVVIIPNVFTPNDDGVNDEYFLDVKNADTFEAAIFNRWGNEMITFNHSTDKWNGKLSSGDQADEGTYFVKYKIVGFDKTIKEGITFFHLGL